MLGKLLGSATRIVNVPLEVVDELTDLDGSGERFLSQPLESTAKAFDNADKGWDKESKE